MARDALTAFRLSSDERAALTARAASLGIPVSHAIRQAVRLWLASREIADEPPPKRGPAKKRKENEAA